MSSSKARIAEAIAGALREAGGLRSLTFAGSFVDKPGLAGISDIDTIVIVDDLTPARFETYVRSARTLTGADLGLPGRRVFVNASLGPLKFDTDEQVVIHLMLYDTVSHRDHVLNSPFTCLDWERHPPCLGAPLRDIYPATALQPRDFLAARRGLANYVGDLERGTLSFRRYEARGGRMVEVPGEQPLDRRHTAAYAYHIVRNLICNVLKMRTGRNTWWDDDALEPAWREHLPGLAHWIDLFRTLRQWKLARYDGPAQDAVARTRLFLREVAASIDRDLARALHVRLVRHGRTPLNDGTFLGRGRNPPLAATPAALEETWTAVYSSPLARAAETAAALAPGATIQLDDRLSEIDYGLAEGLTAAEARERFPDLRRAWEDGRDIAFPGGEDTAGVLARARAFLGALPQGPGRILAVTHNVVVRAILADLLGLRLERAFRIPIEHLEPIDICRIDGRWVPNLAPGVKARVLDGYVA